jgi:hypothetical protein
MPLKKCKLFYKIQRGCQHVLWLTKFSKRNKHQRMLKILKFFGSHQLKGNIFSIFVTSVAATEATIGLNWFQFWGGFCFLQHITKKSSLKF